MINSVVISDNIVSVTVCDPWANIEDVKEEYGITIVNKLENEIQYNGVGIAVAHTGFLDIDYQTYKDNCAVIFDTKSCIKRG